MKFLSLATQHAPFAASRLVLFLTAATAAILGSHLLPSQTPWVLSAMAAIAVAVWHGAFDGVLAEEACDSGWEARWRLPFYLCYVTMTVLVVLLWWAVPIVALTLFLLYSALHFGTEGEPDLSRGRIFSGVATGLIPIVAACHWWPDQVAAIFEQMLQRSPQYAFLLTSLAGRALWPAVFLAVVPGLLKRDGAAAALLTTELFLFRFCSPVAAFAVFFCLWHTPEHVISTSLDGAGRFQLPLLLRHLRRGFLPWLLSLCAMAILFALGRHTLASSLGILFITLSALTVPHMMLAEVLRRASNRASDPARFEVGSHKAGVQA